MGDTPQAVASNGVPGASDIPPDQQFVHLHLHTEYSLLDGGNRVDKLVRRVKELGMTAVAVTDHGNMFGAVAVYQACKEAGIKAILGVEAYVAPGDRTDRTYTGVSDGGYHLVLLAENNRGWDNLLYLCSEAYLTGFYFKPRIDRALLEKHSGGLIAINGHLGSELGEILLSYETSIQRGNPDERLWERAVECARWHDRVFNQREDTEAQRHKGTKGKAESVSARGEVSSPLSLCAPVPLCLPSPSLPRFYVELQRHIPEQNSINKHLIRLARELDLPLVADNDAHFLKAEDHDAHDTLICISMGKSKNDTERLKYPTQLYVKSPQEMREVFEEEGDAGKEACDNTIRIAERCDVKLPIGANHAPMVRVAIPQPEALPRVDDPRFAGDLTAWYTAYGAMFEVRPMASDADEAERAAAKLECDTTLRLLAEAGAIWRYGPGIFHHGGHGEHGESSREESGAGKDKKKRKSTSSSGTAPPNPSDPPSVLSVPSVVKSSPPDESAAIRARLDRELKILCDKNIAAYFLIVWDFVAWGRNNNIPALARGSGVGTMVGYVLGLSNACPVRYGLLFERFTDPDRSEYPDIDIDLCQDGRAEVIDYVRRKYGHVAQIITFGTLKARAALRDVGRVHEIPLAEVDKIAKLIPEALGTTLESALEQEPDLKKLYDSDDRIRRLIDTAKTLEGQARHASVHAAGVIVATRPLYEVVPLYKQSGAADHEVVTQWDGPTCEKMGLLKMDFLGLRTISIVERAKRLIREGLPEEEIWRAVGRERTQGLQSLGSPHPLDLDRLTYDDQRVFDLFRRGDTTGVFQFESGGMRRLLVEMRPDRLEDLIAANALFRPGPMDLIPDYNRRKHGTEPVPKVHEIVDRFTAETYGVMVYQEQVMQIFHELGGIPLRAAYSLIKAISKKKEKEISKQRPVFLEGAISRGLAKPAAEELFEMILKFAGYGFNKSHSTGYAIVAYQTAYLKTYFPNQYMAAFLTFESQAGKVSEWTPYLEDCKRTRFTSGKVGVEVRAPDINMSQADFAVVFEDGEPRTAQHGHVRFGLRGIKGAGDKAVEAVIRERDGAVGSDGGMEGSKDQGIQSDPHSIPRSQDPMIPSSRRPYTSLFEFCERVLAQGATGSGGAIINKSAIDAFIRCGTFDAVHGRETRAAMVATIEAALAAGSKAAADKAAGQGSLFGGGGGGGVAVATKVEAATLARATPWSEAETLANEKEALGFYVSSHPLQKWAPWASVFATGNTETVRTMRQDARVVLAALVHNVRTIIIKNGRSAGQKMAIVTFEDLYGTVETVLFADCYSQFDHLVEPDKVLFVLGRVDHSRGGGGGAGSGAEEGKCQIVVERLVPIEGAPLSPGRVLLTVESDRLNGTGEMTLRSVANLLRAADGGAPAAPPAEDPLDAPAFPIELAVDTGRSYVLLAADKSLRLRLTPEAVAELTTLLGDHCIRVIGGVAVEVQGTGKRENKWAKAKVG